MPKAVIAQANVQEYFYEAVTRALEHQNIEAAEDTIFYIVNLLAHFSRAERLFTETEDGTFVRPLTELYAEALEAPSLEVQTRSLKRLGDVALLISGIFSDSLNRKLVDVDYYIAMGGGAYGHLAELIRDSLRGQALGGIFRELSRKFADFVDVLGEVSEEANLTSTKDVLRLYEIWLRTGSRRAASRLRRLGIEPIAGTLQTH